MHVYEAIAIFVEVCRMKGFVFEKLFLYVFQQVTGLAVECLTQRVKRREADSFRFFIFQD